MSDSEDELDHLQYKVIILGDGAVGKTSLTKRFTNDEFKQSYLQTVGVDWFLKTVKLNEETEVSLQIWDIGGQQLGSKLLKNYIYGSHAVILTYDITSYASYKNLLEWYALVKDTFPNSVPVCALVGNKSDLVHLRAIRQEVHNRWSQEHHFHPFLVSAKSGDNVSEMFLKLASVLAGVEMNSQESTVVKANIVDHPVMDKETEKRMDDLEDKLKKQKTKKTCSIM